MNEILGLSELEIQQVIRKLETVQARCYKLDEPSGEAAALDDAITALILQIPYKPDTPGLTKTGGSFISCGYCGDRVRIGDNYCRNCGHPIDWKDWEGDDDEDD